MAGGRLVQPSTRYQLTSPAGQAGQEKLVPWIPTVAPIEPFQTKFVELSFKMPMNDLLAQKGR
jgi:hypothetical protein